MAPTRFVSSRLGAVALLLFLLGMSLAFFRGRLETSDEVQMALTSMSLAERASFRWDREYQGLAFSGYGAGTPLVGIPAYWLNRALAVLGTNVSFGPILPLVVIGEVRLGLSSVQTVGRFLHPPPYRHPLRLPPIQDYLDHRWRVARPTLQ